MNKNVDPAKMFSPGYTMTSDIISLLNTHEVEVIKHVGEFGDRYNLATSEEDVKYMKQQLSKGNPIIIGINGGTWIKTNGYSAHWMTILGIKDDGSIFVSDPGCPFPGVAVERGLAEIGIRERQPQGTAQLPLLKVLGVEAAERLPQAYQQDADGVMAACGLPDVVQSLGLLAEDPHELLPAHPDVA